MFRRGHELGSKRPGWLYPSGDWVREAERMNLLARRLPAVLRGEEARVEFDDAVVLAQMCYAQEHHAAAVRSGPMRSPLNPSGPTTESSRTDITQPALLL